MGEPERCQYSSKQAVFLVEVGPACYIATWYVDGKKIVSRSGALRHRLRILLYDTPVPTMISLEGGGFSAWAILRPDNVTHCTLDLSLPKKHQTCSQVLRGTRVLSEPFSPNDVTEDASAQSLEPSMPQAVP